MKKDEWKQWPTFSNGVIPSKARFAASTCGLPLGSNRARFSKSPCWRAIFLMTSQSVRHMWSFYGTSCISLHRMRFCRSPHKKLLKGGRCGRCHYFLPFLSFEQEVTCAPFSHCVSEWSHHALPIVKDRQTTHRSTARWSFQSMRAWFHSWNWQCLLQNYICGVKEGFTCLDASSSPLYCTGPWDHIATNVDGEWVKSGTVLWIKSFCLLATGWGSSVIISTNNG